MDLVYWALLRKPDSGCNDAGYGFIWRYWCVTQAEPDGGFAEDALVIALAIRDSQPQQVTLPPDAQ